MKTEKVFYFRFRERVDNCLCLIGADADLDFFRFHDTYVMQLIRAYSKRESRVDKMAFIRSLQSTCSAVV